MNTMIRKNALSEADREELYEILRKGNGQK